ncbi:hypothetical protein [Kitasatospora sp. NPDC088134]|uniref:hypothetical protein n=1 Tax=Kitasatospora sp. NPDC088134 TaxID=3364071 RepID=UPI0038155E1C
MTVRTLNDADDTASDTASAAVSAAVSATDGETRQSTREELGRFADQGGFTLTADANPWLEAAETLTGPEEARAASTVLAELRSRDTRAVGRAANAIADKAGLRIPDTLGGLTTLLDLLQRVHATTATLRPEVYARDLGQLAAATGTGAYRKAVGAKLGWNQRRSLRAQARTLAAAGARRADLHTALVAAVAAHRDWTALAEEGSRPAVPVDGALLTETANVVESLADAVRSLARLLPERALDSLPLAELADLVDRLAADEGTLYRLSALRQLRLELAEQGLTDLLEELTERQADKDAALAAYDRHHAARTALAGGPRQATDDVADATETVEPVAEVAEAVVETEAVEVAEVAEVAAVVEVTEPETVVEAVEPVAESVEVAEPEAVVEPEVAEIAEVAAEVAPEAEAVESAVEAVESEPVAEVEVVEPAAEVEVTESVVEVEAAAAPEVAEAAAETEAVEVTVEAEPTVEADEPVAEVAVEVAEAAVEVAPEPEVAAEPEIVEPVAEVAEPVTEVEPEPVAEAAETVTEVVEPESVAEVAETVTEVVEPEPVAEVETVEPVVEAEAVAERPTEAEPVAEVEPVVEPVVVAEAVEEVVPEAEPVAEAAQVARPEVVPGKPITGYSAEELVALVAWLDADGTSRSDDELLRAAMKELGFARLGPRIKEALAAAVASVRA